MGVRWCLSVFLWLCFCVCVLHALQSYTICDVQGCNCTERTRLWLNVNCNLHGEQELRLEPGHVPKTITEIFIVGGKILSFAPKTFNSLSGFTLMRIEGVKSIEIEKKSFLNIVSPSLLVQVLGCDEVTIKTGAFEDMQSFLSTEVIGANSVTLEQAAFSKLHNSTFKDIRKMALAKGTFEFRNQGSFGRHGPVSVVLFVNVGIPTLPQEVFLTALAEVTFRDCRIGSVQSEAFRATEIASVVIVNSTVDTIEENAFTERTLIISLKISKCTIAKIESKAVMAGITNLTVNHSFITDIQPHAVEITVAQVEIIGNQISNFHTAAFVFTNWNRIAVEDNIIKHLHSRFLDVRATDDDDVERVTFKGNEIQSAHETSLSFMRHLRDGVLHVDDNFFNKTCDCHLAEWAASMTNDTETVRVLMETSFCAVDEFLSRCFSLPVGVINMRNFSEITCVNETVCEPYHGETRIIDTTSRIFVQDESEEKRSWLIFVVVVIGCFIIALVATFVALLIRGSRWLKRKGYFRNIQYNRNEASNEEEEENTIVTVDETEKLEIPDELTIEFLQVLSQRLDDPNTHQEASEMIERLYEMFIVDESFENNNRQDEEAHLYEELGNLSLQIPPPPYEEKPTQATSSSGPRCILRLMEEKFGSLGPEDGAAKPALAGDYSEPNDAAVHLYSELKQNAQLRESIASEQMALRPLPVKPDVGFSEAGPSSKT